MRGDAEVLQRSMDASPDEWLDQLVTERVLDEVRQQGAGHARSAVRARLEWLGTLRRALGRLVPPLVQPLLWRRSNQDG